MGVSKMLVALAALAALAVGEVRASVPEMQHAAMPQVTPKTSLKSPSVENGGVSGVGQRDVAEAEPFLIAADGDYAREIFVGVGGTVGNLVGAAFGTFFGGPGVGTAAGGALGTGIGGLLGGYFYDRLRKP